MYNLETPWFKSAAVQNTEAMGQRWSLKLVWRNPRLRSKARRTGEWFSRPQSTSKRKECLEQMRHKEATNSTTRADDLRKEETLCWDDSVFQPSKLSCQCKEENISVETGTIIPRWWYHFNYGWFAHGGGVKGSFIMQCHENVEGEKIKLTVSSEICKK